MPSVFRIVLQFEDVSASRSQKNRKQALTHINILTYLCIVNACLPVTYYIGMITYFFQFVQYFFFLGSSITCVNSMEVSYIPIAKARGFTTHWITFYALLR